MIRRIAAGDESMAKTARAVQWQVDHFTEIPVLVVACLRLGTLEGRVPFVRLPHAVESAYYGSIYPSVQNLLLAARAMGLGASLITLPLWRRGFGAQDPQTAARGHAVLRRGPRLAARGLRADHPQTGRAGTAPGCLRQSALARLVREGAHSSG